MPPVSPARARDRRALAGVSVAEAVRLVVGALGGEHDRRQRERTRGDEQDQVAGPHGRRWCHDPIWAPRTRADDWDEPGSRVSLTSPPRVLLRTGRMQRPVLLSGPDRSALGSAFLVHKGPRSELDCGATLSEVIADRIS